MPLSWNEIRDRATHFATEWAGVTSERAEAQTFWNEFFEVFGITRKRVAIFEKHVALTRNDARTGHGFIDAFWKGVLLVEHKSAGESLDKAFDQAADYFDGIAERDLPRFIIVSDFARFRLYDLETGDEREFPLSSLRDNVGLFGFIAGYQAHKIEAKEEAASIAAAEQLGKLHDLLKASGYVGHPLEVMLVRILFCLFADDTGIFDRNQFREYLETRTAEDGSDLGMHLGKLFEVLNRPVEARSPKLDEQLGAFTYVNGRLFDQTLPLADFDSAMREALLDASALDWSAISPAIFGSLFQSIMDREARRNLGAHYTREVNILKALRPLFLDDLKAELDSIGANTKRLIEFQKKLAATTVLDPACGCGNFLVIAYRELRLLELEVLRRLHQPGKSSRIFHIKALVFVDVDQFYGIELEDFPAQIAQVAMWLTDHQMNLRVSDEFGQYFARLPLIKSPNIVHDNALRITWEEVIQPAALSFIVGNPPFAGAMMMSDSQRQDIAQVFHGIKGAGILDYVCAWYVKAMRYLQGDQPKGRIRCAFVSTNSIAQGEQVGILWRLLLGAGAHIHFAHRTFQWSSEAPGQAAVQCVIIGFGLGEAATLRLFDYETPDGEPHESKAKHINPYLVDGPDVLLENRSAPICDVPAMRFGSMPRDGGYLILLPEERDEIVNRWPQAKRWIRPYTGAEEFLNGGRRFCLWLLGAAATDIRAVPAFVKRLEACRQYRLASKAASTRRAAATPGIFVQLAQPDSDYLLVPRVSSERRPYIPIGFMSRDVIANDQVLTVAGATRYHFGIMMSLMHMAWVRYTCGRLESRYRYSKDIVYNNFPWPEPTDRQRTAIEEAADLVLKIRGKFSPATPASLYDPIAMPVELVKAHRALDRVVDAAYSRGDFKTEADRVALLLSLHQRISRPPELDLAATPSTPRNRPKRRSARAPTRARGQS